MYMKCSKKELASMMAERDKYMSPDACKEFEEVILKPRTEIPDWCGYPKDLQCMSLFKGYVTGEDYCKNCDAYNQNVATK